MPFRTRPGQPRDLLALIESEVRERIEEAVDGVSLEVMVEARRAHGRPAPAAGSAEDRQEYEAGVSAFLRRLETDIGAALPTEDRRKLEQAAGVAGDEVRRLVAFQVALARALPDYWQRFEAVRAAYASERIASGGERRGLLSRLLRD